MDFRGSAFEAATHGWEKSRQEECKGRERKRTHVWDRLRSIGKDISFVGPFLGVG